MELESRVETVVGWFSAAARRVGDDQVEALESVVTGADCWCRRSVATGLLTWMRPPETVRPSRPDAVDVAIDGLVTALREQLHRDPLRDDELDRLIELIDAPGVESSRRRSTMSVILDFGV
jgi:hypothetical protein